MLVVPLSQQQEELGSCVSCTDGYISCQIVSPGWVVNISEIVFVLKVIIWNAFTLEGEGCLPSILTELSLDGGVGSWFTWGTAENWLGVCLCSRMLSLASA